MAKKIKLDKQKTLLKSREENVESDLLFRSAQKSPLIDHYGLKKGFYFLHKNCHRKINVTDIVEATGLSRRGFYKAFNKHFAISPAKILRLQRLDMAKDLLNTSNLSLTEIANIIGFRNVNSFWVSFKNTEGISPGEFRRESRLSSKF